jgi:hypothetical protein
MKGKITIAGVSVLFLFSMTWAGNNIVSLHPGSLMMSLIPNRNKTFLLDYERIVTENQSVVLSGGYSGTDTDIKTDDFSVTIDATSFVLFAGIKHYFGKQQRGWYLAGRIGGTYTDLSMESEDKSDIFAESDAFAGEGMYYAGLVFLGYQWRWDNNILLNIDGGAGYQHIPFEVDLWVPGQMELIITMMNMPVAFDVNIALGYSF